MTAPVAIELFCGCGGLSTGLLDAGVRVVAGFDSDRPSIEAFAFNHQHRGARAIQADLVGRDAASLLDMAGTDRVDLVAGGPPCQPFSIAGRRLGLKDKRARLVAEFIRIVGELRPPAFLFENVPNFASMLDGQLLAELRQAMSSLGYSVTDGVLVAADYGVPQLRRRLFVLGYQKLSPPRLPFPTHGSPLLGLERFRTAADALQDLPDAADYGECGVFNHEPTSHSGVMLERFATLVPGRRERNSFHDRLHSNKPSYTLRAGTGNFSPLRPVHYKYDRVVTVRESARLQSFPDDFIWPDWIPRLQQYRQVGNAVPPLLARRVAESMALDLGWQLEPAQLVGDPSARPNPITLTDDEKRSQRRSRTRGASLGKAGLRAQDSQPQG